MPKAKLPPGRRSDDAMASCDFKWLCQSQTWRWGIKSAGGSRGGLRDFHMELVRRDVLTDISPSLHSSCCYGSRSVSYLLSFESRGNLLSSRRRPVPSHPETYQSGDSPTRHAPVTEAAGTLVDQCHRSNFIYLHDHSLKLRRGRICRNCV